MRTTLAPDTKRLTLTFVLPFVQSVDMSQPLSIEIFDKSYFVDFETAKRYPVTLACSPTVCHAVLHRATPCRDDDKICQMDWANGRVPEWRRPDLIVVSCP